MSVEEPSPDTPTYSGAQPSLSRADVAIGSVTRQVFSRSVEPLVPSSSNVPQPQAVRPEADIVHVPPTPIAVAPIDQHLSQISPLVQQADVSPVQNQQAASSGAQSTSETSKAPHLKVLLPALSGIAFVVLAGAFAGFIHWHARRNNPNVIFDDALQASLMTTQLEQQTRSGAYYNLADFDFSNTTSPIVSTQSTLSQNGSDFQLAGYGTAKNTYISYMKFPNNISSNITSMITNGWVQIRSNGQLPKNASMSLDNIADPRYQDIGLLSFGNFNKETRTQLVNYINAEHIYDFQASKVTHTTVNSESVLAYPVSININYLKIYAESIATDEGFSPADVTSAVNDLGDWTHARATFYVSTISHRFVAVDLSQGGNNTRLSFSNYNNDSLPQEPVTNLNWQDFAPVQQMIEQEAADHQTSSKYGMKTPALAIPIT